MKTVLIASALTLAVIGTASAAEFYIVQDATTKKCTIVEQKPVEKTVTVVGDGKVYTTRTEAEAGLKTVKVCSSN